MQWSLAFHIIGVVLWLGGLLLLTRFARLTTEPGFLPNAAFSSLVRKSWFIYVIHGVALVLITGLYQILAGGGFGVYFKQGWFHGKITLVMVLLVATVMLGMDIQRIAQSLPANPRRLRTVQMLALLSLFGIVFLTKVFRA
ncbi:MAG: CopD family protein [Deltaproteobacteria bacterium]|nr:CopD family protein [Deltaproteobacteria bacterium]